MTYWAINAVFLAVVAMKAAWSVVLVRRGRRAPIGRRTLAITVVVLLVMTAVFDNVMIGVGLVGYDPARISGVFIGVAPIEDFAYAIAAAVLLPSLWVTLGPRLSEGSNSTPLGNANSGPLGNADAATDATRGRRGGAAPAHPGRETSA